jgi:HAD superfamily hydrolase (TIGR01490 family)
MGHDVCPARNSYRQFGQVFMARRPYHRARARTPGTGPILVSMPGAAFFDLDKTVLSRSSTLAFSRSLYKEGFISRANLVKGVFAQFVYLLVGADEGKMDKMRDAAVELTRGWERDRVIEIVREVLDEVVTPHIYAEALDLIHEHQEAGRRVYLVSSSPEEIVFPLAAAIKVDGVIATRAEIDEMGRYTGKLEFYCYGPNKIDAMRQEARRWGIDLADSYAYSDSVTDSWMLFGVGHPHAVNPDRDLRRAAESQGWPILAFRRPVTLRTRISKAAPPRPVTVGAAGAIAAVFVAWAFVRPRVRRHRAA